MPDVGDEMMGDGHVITGATVSVLLTLKRHVAVLPPKSVATHVTVVFATGNAYPDVTTVVLPIVHTVDLTARSSADVTANATATVGTPPVGVTWKSAAGHVMVGATVSGGWTLTLNVHAVASPTLSVAVQVTLVP